MPNLEEVLSKVTAEAIEIDFDNYQDASEFPPPAPEGVYTFKQESSDFDVTGKGDLMAILNHTIVAPGEPVDGHKLNFDRVSAKVFDRNGAKVSAMMDQIRALGIVERPRSAEDLGKAIKSGDGSLWKGQTQWEAGCNHAGTDKECEWGESEKVFRLKGMRKFPTLPNGNYDPETTCTVCGNKVQARERISRRIPA